MTGTAFDDILYDFILRIPAGWRKVENSPSSGFPFLAKRACPVKRQAFIFS